MGEFKGLRPPQFTAVNVAGYGFVNTFSVNVVQANIYEYTIVSNENYINFKYDFI
jgi:hypothetical protein